MIFQVQCLHEFSIKHEVVVPIAMSTNPNLFTNTSDTMMFNAVSIIIKDRNLQKKIHTVFFICLFIIFSEGNVTRQLTFPSFKFYTYTYNQ